MVRDDRSVTVLLPSRSARFAALAIDLLLPGALVGLLALGGSVVAGFPLDATPARLMVALLLVVVVPAVLSSLASWLSGGQSIGKAIVGLEVRRAGHRWDGRLVTLLWAFGRCTVGYVLVDGLGFGGLGAVTGSYRRAAHDLVFSSQVVAIDPARFGDVATRREMIDLRLRDFERRRSEGIARNGDRYGHWLRLLRWANGVIKVVAVAATGLIGWAFGSASATQGATGVVSGGTTMAPGIGALGQVSISLAGGALVVGVVGVGTVGSTSGDYADLVAEGRVVLFLASDGVASNGDGTVETWSSTDGTVRLEPGIGLPPPVLRQSEVSDGHAVQFSDAGPPGERTTPLLVAAAPEQLPRGASDRTVLVVLHGESLPAGGFGVGWGAADVAEDPNYPHCSDMTYCRSFVTGAVRYNCFSQGVGVATGLGDVGSFCGGQAIDELYGGDAAVGGGEPVVITSRVADGSLTLRGGGIEHTVDNMSFDTEVDALWVGGWPVEPQMNATFEVFAAVVYDRALRDPELERAAQELLRLAETPPGP